VYIGSAFGGYFGNETLGMYVGAGIGKLIYLQVAIHFARRYLRDTYFLVGPHLRVKKVIRSAGMVIPIRPMPVAVGAPTIAAKGCPLVKRPFLSLGSFNPYRPPSVAVSVLAVLVGLLVGYVPFREYLDYRDFRDNTIPVEATISGISKKWTEGSRPHLQATVLYTFKTPDGRPWSGTMVRPAIRAEHLRVGARIPAMYKRNNPARNTTQDQLDFKLHWFLMPAAIGLALWFMANLFFIFQAIELRSREAEAQRIGHLRNTRARKSFRFRVA